MLKPILNAALITLLLYLSGSALARDRIPEFVGSWVINHELTDEIAPEFKDRDVFSGLGQGRVQVSVMGIPLPSSGPKAAPASVALKDPEVLSSNEMQIEQSGKSLNMIYKGVGSETLKKGDFRGRTTNWTRDSIRQHYKSTYRKVTKEWEVRSDGRLLVTVTINPNKDKKRVYKRIFDRVEAEDGSSDG